MKKKIIVGVLVLILIGVLFGILLIVNLNEGSIFEGLSLNRLNSITGFAGEGGQNPVYIEGQSSGLSFIPYGQEGYDMQSNGTNYSAYFKNNSDTSKAVSFTVEGYSFSFDIAASQATGYSSVYRAITSPALNPLNTQISIEGERATYPDAWNNSNLTYFLGSNGLKENIVVSSLPAFSPLADFFRYRVNVYYNNSLQVCVDDVCYLHPSSVDLNTTGGIAFKDSDNKTIFNVPHGIITDSNGSSANLTYFLSLNNGIDIWYIGIPVSFLEDAVYPVYIDPSLYEYDDDTVIEQTTIGGADWRAQSFTIGTVGANEAFTITSIKFYGVKSGSPGTLNASIYLASGDSPTGAILSSGTLAEGSISSSDAWNEITMSSYELQPSTKYVLVMHSPSTSVIWYQAANNYAGGAPMDSFNSGGSWSSSGNYDQLFEIWGEAGGGAVNYTLNITNPTTSSPLSVSNGSNISVYFNFSNDTAYLTSGVSIDSVFIGGKNSSIVTMENPLTNLTVFSDGFETDLTKWDDNGATAWDLNTTDPHSGSQSIAATNNNENNLTTDDIDVSNSSYLNISFWYMERGTLEVNDMRIYLFDGSNYDVFTDSFEAGSNNVWQWANFTTSDSQYFKSNFKVRLYAVLGTGEAFQVDDFKVISQSGGLTQEYTYIPNIGWQVNVTVPDFPSGSEDLFVNATYDGNTKNDTQTNAITYTGGGVDCGDLSTANATYTLTGNVSSTGTCFNITAQNITLDCNNSWINYSIGGAANTYGVYTDQFNATIKNCNIIDGNWTSSQNTRHAIYFNANVNSTVYNNSINVSNGIGIDLNFGANFNNITKNRAISNSGYGIQIFHSSNNTLKDNYAESGSSNGLEVYRSSSNTLINNTGISKGGGTGIILSSEDYSTTNNLLINNTGRSNSGNGITLSTSPGNFLTAITATSNSGYGIILAQSSNNLFRDCVNISGVTDVYLVSSSSNNVFINCSYNISKEAVSSGSLLREWYYQAYVNYTNGTGVSDANVSIYDKNSALKFTEQTNSTGWIQRKEVTDYLNSGGSRTFYNNYTINASKTGYSTGTHSFNFTIQQNKINDFFTLGVGDTTPPNFLTIPANVSLFYGNQSLLVIFVGNDTSFGYYYTNDTRFSINQTGFLSNATPMAVGNYEINVTINDTSGNINWTRYKVQVNKSTYFNCGVYFNATSPITYPANFRVYTNCSSTYTLYRNGTGISNGSTINGGAGYYNLTVQRTDTANYTYTVNTRFFTVNKNQEKFRVLFNATSPLTYPDVFLVYANSTTSFTLRRNGTSISNNSVQRNGAGYFNFSAQRTDTQNYSFNYNQTSFTVNKNTENCMVLFNATSPLTYPDTFRVWANCTTTFTLYRNGTSVNNNSEQALSPGYYNFSMLRDSVNNTIYFNQTSFTINSPPDNTPPIYNSVSANNTFARQITLFSVNVSDNVALQSNGGYIFSTNNSGTWVNDTLILFTTTPSWANITKILNSTGGMGIGYRWYFNDSAGNTNSTLIYTLITTTDSTPPTITFEEPPTPTNGSTVTSPNQTITANISDSFITSSWIDFDRSLLGYWAMDYYNATGIFDNSTYDNFGGFQGGLNYSNLTTGARGMGLMFDGVNDYLTLGNFTLNQYSFSLWVKRRGTYTGWNTIIGSDQGGSYELDFDFAGDGSINAYSAGELTSTSALNIGQWYHVVLVTNLTGTFMYIDGVLNNSNSATPSINSALILGALNEGQYLNASLDEVMIFNRSLTQGEVKALYDSQSNKFNASFTNLSEVQHNYTVYAVDEYGNHNDSGLRNFIYYLERIGTLNVTWVNPTQDYNFSQYAFRNFTIKVSCINGDCGNVTAYLDPPSKYEWYYNSTALSPLTQIGGTEWRAQSFTVGTVGTNEAFTITSIKFYGYKDSSPGTLNVSLYAASGDNPTGPILSSGTLAEGSISSSEAWNEITMSSYELQASTKYVMVFHCPSDDVIWYQESGYTGGTALFSSNSGSSWTNDNPVDQLFEVWGEVGGGTKTGLVNTTVGATPFYTTDPNPTTYINNTCLQDMHENDFCLVSWYINATGAADSQHTFYGYANSSSLTGTNYTSNITVTIVAYVDTCVYSSGNWDIDCSQNCVISSNVDVGGNNISITGEGTFVTTANITNYDNLYIKGIDYLHLCRVRCINGGCFKG